MDLPRITVSFSNCVSAAVILHWWDNKHVFVAFCLASDWASECERCQRWLMLINDFITRWDVEGWRFSAVYYISFPSFQNDASRPNPRQAEHTELNSHQRRSSFFIFPCSRKSSAPQWCLWPFCCVLVLVGEAILGKKALGLIECGDTDPYCNHMWQKVSILPREFWTL